MERHIPFFRPSINEEEIEAVTSVLRSGWLTSGPKVKTFEDLFTQYLGVQAVALSSCTAALHLSLLVLGVKPGDTVITSPITFPATVNAIEMAGGVPLLCDVEEGTLNIDMEKLEDLLKKGTRPKAVIPVHFAGQPCDMEALAYLAKRYQFAIVEDAAHALGATYKEHRTGSGYGPILSSLPWTTCFSFYPNKPTTTGEGGMLVAADKMLAERARLMSNHGITAQAWERYGDVPFYHWETVCQGFKYNMSDISAALGISQMGKLEALHKRRANIDRLYRRLLKEKGLNRLVAPLEQKPHRMSAFHLFVVKVMDGKRDLWAKRLKDRGIGIGIHYRALFYHSYFHQRYGWDPQSYPTAARVSHQVLSLPLYPDMKEKEVEYAVGELCQLEG